MNKICKNCFYFGIIAPPSNDVQRHCKMMRKWKFPNDSCKNFAKKTIVRRIKTTIIKAASGNNGECHMTADGCH